MSDTATANVWRRLLGSFTPGEMTVREWCDQQGVSLHQYYYWRRRLAPAPDPNGTSPSGRWLAVEGVGSPGAPTPCARLTVRVGVAAIELEPGFDPLLLRAVVEALTVDAC